MALEKTRGRKPAAGELAVVVGAGRSGIAAARLLAKEGVKTRLLEKKPDLLLPLEKDALEKAGIELRLGEHNRSDFENASFVITSPGIPIAAIRPFIQDNERVELISEMELAWRYLEDEPLIAITGTSGKTTTASLTAAMLKAQGYSVFLGGNIGTPLSEYILDPRKADAIVLEISSFQLQGCNTFCPRVGILLNISPNHLDYHKDMAEYTEAKFRLFRCQDENDIAIINKNLEPLTKLYKVPGRKIFVSETGRFPNMRLFGKHNAYNAECAWQAARVFGVSQENATEAVKSFEPLPHRLETVKEINDVIYVNDSKCTTVAALKVALEAFERPVRLLCGGKFKGGDLTSLIPLIKEKVSEVALFGASREYFEKAWQDIVPISWHSNLKEAVKTLKSNAKPGEAILLAPATSSFDLYKNYMERGEDFRKIVENL